MSERQIQYNRSEENRIGVRGVKNESGFWIMVFDSGYWIK